MMILSILLLMFVNAISNNQAKSVFYSRITMFSLLSSIIICYNNLYVTSLNKGISLYNGLLNVSTLTQSFTLFVLIITCIILIYNSFSLRLEKYKTLTDKNSFLNNSKGLDKEQYKNALNIIYNDTKNEILNIKEYSLIISFILTGACFLMCSGDLITLFITIELQSYGLYILSTLYKDSEQATRGGLTYFLLGGLSSCFILLASSLIYINTGNTSLEGFYIINSITEIANNVDYLHNNFSNNLLQVSNENSISFKSLILYDSNYINIALIILSVGFLFKVSAAPFHFWSPDVYDAIPTTVTTFVAIIAKISLFVFLLELVYYIGGNMQIDLNLREITSSNNLLYLTWKDLILLSSLLSFLTGSILGLTQNRIKRLYAYSTISHVGFILLALSINTTESIEAYIFYILSYTISNLNAFMILVAIGYTMYFYTYKTEIIKREWLQIHAYINTIRDNEKITNNVIFPNNNETFTNNHENNKNIKEMFFQNALSVWPFKKNYELKYDKENKDYQLKDVNYSAIQLISQLKGYFYINTYLALSLAITLFSFIGIPPLIGFFAKQMVLSAALDNGYIFITLLGIITSVIAAAYYLNVIKLIFFFESEYIINPFFIKSIYFSSANFTSKHSYFSLFFFKDKSYILSFIRLSQPLCIIISILTLYILLYIFVSNEILSLSRIITVLFFI